MGFEMSPHILHWIEFRRVSGQPFHGDSALCGGDILLDQPTAMDGRAIPQDHEPARNVPLEVAEKLDDLEAFDAARVNLKVKTPQGQPANDREALPVEGFLQHRSLPARSPSPHPGRTGAQSAFVNEDNGPPLLAGFFFKAGQTSFFQRAMASSSRSTARRSGRWQLKPLAPKRRQTWPG